MVSRDTTRGPIDVLKTLEKLPKFCAVLIPGAGKVGIVRRGVKGYYSSTIAPVDVDAFNTRQGVTVAQAEAMLVGSMFGWEVPGADPDNYNPEGEWSHG